MEKVCYVCNSLDTCTRIYRSEYLITVIMVFTIRPFFHSLMCLLSCDFFSLALSVYFCRNFALLWILFPSKYATIAKYRAKYMIIIIIIVIHLYLLVSAHGKKRTQFLVIFLKLLLCEFSYSFWGVVFSFYFFFHSLMLTHLIIIISVLRSCALESICVYAYSYMNAKHEVIKIFAIYLFYSFDSSSLSNSFIFIEFFALVHLAFLISCSFARYKLCTLLHNASIVRTNTSLQTYAHTQIHSHNF